MARERVSKKFLQVHTVSISEKERAVISWIVSADNKGYDLQESEMVASIIQELDLETGRQIAVEELDNFNDYDLSGYEIRFLHGLLTGLFNEKKVSAQRVIPCLSLYRKFESIMNQPIEEDSE